MSSTTKSLPANYRFEEFEFVRMLGEGGFGITYLGWDHHLDKPVAIKEYFPEDWAKRDQALSVMPLSERYHNDFDWGRQRFLAEAKTLAKFNHPHVVKAYRYFEANGTGYIVMEYVEGEPLDALLADGAVLDAANVRFILERIASGLDNIHAVDFLHRDIKPANVILSVETGEPILIDFGAARQTVTTKTTALTAIVTPGYGPHEQYSVEGENQGPWTDIYSLSALGYKALTGIVPPEGNSRFENDTYRPLDEKAFDDAPLCKAINTGLRVLTVNRPRSAREWLTLAESDLVDTLQSPVRSKKTRSKTAKKKTAPRTVRPHKRSGAGAFIVSVVTAVLIVGGALATLEFNLLDGFKSDEVVVTKTLSNRSGRAALSTSSTTPQTSPLRRGHIRQVTLLQIVQHAPQWLCFQLEAFGWEHPPAQWAQANRNSLSEP